MTNEDMKLQDVQRPNLYRETFPYTEFPRVIFDGSVVPFEIPDSIWITDTTFRDGQQARPPYTPEQILKIYDFLHQIDAGTGLIRQCEFFLYSKRDRKAVELCKERGYEFPQITGWIRAVAADFKLVADMGLAETGILTSASDYHIFLKLRKTRSQALAGYLDVVKTALDSNIIPRCHFEDITRADYEGFVLPFAAELMKLAQQYDLPVKIRLCDTLGFGIPFPGSALPRSVPKLIYGLRKIGVPSEWLEWHGHNDLHKVQVNAATAWLYGCCAANTSIFGVGERTGNPPLEALVAEHAQIKGTDARINYGAITELANYASRELGFNIPANYPLVGMNFNVTRAGIHADGLLKNEEIYNCFDTRKLLNRPVGVAITDKTGAAGIKHYIEERYQIEIAKHDPRVVAIKDKIDSEYAADRVSAISDEEMNAWINEAFGKDLPPLR
ncbi:MAG TPA: 2-isopropylmalate synthase [Planctomycetes bacterium]|nr:2-isopropylmalate synthase [Planctomycetota bacterium]HIJ72116.1 2-isopropylmalate synthase [Planctomycetota bacterium]